MTALTRKRLAAGLTKSQLAEKLGLDPSTVGKWESGKSTPEPRFFPALAEIFGVSAEEVTYLFVPDESKASPASSP